MAYKITEVCNGCGVCTRVCPVGAISGEYRTQHIIESALCIDCGACGRICPAGAVKDPFGIYCVMVKKSEWEIPQFERRRCMSCGICIDACPVNCLELSMAEGYGNVHNYPRLSDPGRCIGCGFCARECPADAIYMGKRR